MAAPKEENPILVAFTLDFETGGLKCQTSACTQIAIHATRLDTFERIGTYVKYIYPYNQKDIKGVTAKRKVLKSKYDTEVEKPMNVKWRKEWQRFLFTRMEVCKRIAPGLKKRERDAAHKVTSEFMRIKDMLFHRKDRAGEDKKSSVIDLTDGEYVQWLAAATDARDRYLAGELSEEEAMAIIYVPTKDELLEQISSELTLETAATQS